MGSDQFSPEMETFCDDLEELYREHVENRQQLSRQDDEIGVLFQAAHDVLKHKGRNIE